MRTVEGLSRPVSATGASEARTSAKVAEVNIDAAPIAPVILRDVAQNFIERDADAGEPVRQVEQAAHLFFVVRRQPQSGNVEQAAIARQQADDHGFAVLGRHGGDTDVDIGPRRLQSRRAILGKTAFRDVESGKNLDP